MNNFSIFAGTMMLVEYSSSSDEEAESENYAQTSEDGRLTCHGPLKSAQAKTSEPLPSVPQDIVNMFSGIAHGNLVDDPRQHSGRVRGFEHERGNWATHVYIPFHEPADFDHLLIRLLGCLECGWQPVDDFHISLSRTFPIRHHWIDGLYQSLKSRLKIRRFGISFHGYQIYVNDERTRSFLGVNVLTGRQSLLQSVGEVDRCLDEYRLPTYYDPPEFHLSLVWCLGDVTQTITETQHQTLETLLSTSVEDLSFRAEQAVMKTGNRIFNLPFS